MAAARSIIAVLATGISSGCGGMGPTRSHSSPAMSSGSSSRTGPGRSSWATRNASRTSVGIVPVATIWCASLVSGFIAATMSTIWNLAWREARMPFCPVIMTIGMAPTCANAAAVVRFSAPGPSVVMQTPGLPVRRP